MSGAGVPSRDEFEVQPEPEQEPDDNPYADQNDLSPSTTMAASEESPDEPYYPQDLVDEKPPPIRILLISNTPRLDPADRNLQIELSRVDLVVSLGNVDLVTLDRLMLPSTQGVCVFAPTDPLQAPSRFTRLHGNGITFRNWKIAGLSGSLINGPATGGLYMSEEESYNMLRKLPPCDIFITRSPPRNLQESPVPPGLAMPAIDEYLSTRYPIYHFYAHPAINEAVESYGGEFETITVGISGHEVTPLIEYV